MIKDLRLMISGRLMGMIFSCTNLWMENDFIHK